MASKQSGATPVAAHNGGQSYQWYNPDTNSYETRTPIVQQQQQRSSSSSSSSQSQASSSTPSNTQSKSNPNNPSGDRKAAGSSMQKSGGGLIDYIDKMLQIGMPQRSGGGGGSGGPASPMNPAGGGVTFPTPRDQRPMNGDDEVQRALDSGLSWEEIAAGAAGAAAALIGQQVLSRMNKSNNPTGPNDWDPNSGVGEPPKTNTRPSVDMNKSQGNILERNGLIEGQPSNNPDIDQQFYEIFGLPKPVRPGMEPRLTTPDSVNGPANTQTIYVPPYRDSSIPGPNQRQKQLGDMDSPTYRENFGYNDIAQRAQDIVDRMEMYGDYDISKYMDPSSEPAVARQVGALLRGML